MPAMILRALRRCLPLLAVTAVLPVEAQESRLGTVSFPTSAGPAAQAEFLTGVLWLHSFEYVRAADAFRRAQTIQPDFALAYWGEAMTHTHPVWNEQDLRAGREILRRLGPDAATRRARAPTDRERRYLDAVEVLYGEGSKAGRDTLYAQAMERLVRAYPEDHEAKAFYALSLLGLNQGIRDTVQYLASAPYADTVFRANPLHPGAAHYLIHAYDDPFHARKGLDAARAYSGIAPDAPHAQHMTTHIFLALGMWDEVVSQNRIAMRLTAHIPGHYSSWLHYGLLQQGRVHEALRLLERLHADRSVSSGSSTHTYESLMRANQLLHFEERQGGPAQWELEVQRMTPLGRVIDTYVRGAMAYRRRDGAVLAAASAEAGSVVADLRSLTVEEGTTPELMQAEVMARELGALLLFLNGAREAAVRAMREATALEDRIPLEFGPPLIVEPSHELLGTMLLEMNPTEAMQEFERALVLAPGRSRALQGLIRAAVAAGDSDRAEAALSRLGRIWHQAETICRDELRHLRRLVNGMR